MSWVGIPALLLINTVSIFSFIKLEQLHPLHRVGMRIEQKRACENVTVLQMLGVDHRVCAFGVLTCSQRPGRSGGERLQVRTLA